MQDEEFNEFPLDEFKNAGQINNDKDPGLQQARAAELYNIKQDIIQPHTKHERSIKVSHMHNHNENEHDEIHMFTHTVNCQVYVPYNEEKQEILLPSTTEMSCKENTKALYAEENINEWNADPYLDEAMTDTETFSYAHYDGPKQVMVQAVYIGNYARILADIKGEVYSTLMYNQDGSLEGIYDDTYTIPMYIDNGTTVNIMPTWFYEKANFLHHLPKHSAQGEIIRTGNGVIQAHFWTDIQLNIQGCLLQFKVLVCDMQAQTGILVSKMALEQLKAWQDYSTSTMYIKQSSVPLFATQRCKILPGQKIVLKAVLDRSMKDIYQSSYMQGNGVCWIWSNDSSKPCQPVVATFVKDKTLITFENVSGATQIIKKGACIGVLDMRSKDGAMTNFDWEFPTDDDGNLVLYVHIFANALESTKLADEKENIQADTCLKISQEPKNHSINTPTVDDPYPWLEKDDPHRNMTEEEIIRNKIPLQNSNLNDAEKEKLIELIMDNKDAFSIRDEIGTCPYFEIKLQLRDDKPFFVRPYNVREDHKPIIQKEMDRLEKLGIIKKALTGYSSPVLLVKRKQQNLYRVVTDFRVLNEWLVRVNHAFSIVRDCLEAIGASKCEVMSVLDLRDAYHTLPLAEESQKYCGITPYYGCPTYVYLHMGMGMSCSPALWQQFVHVIWEELPNKERYKIIMDDILIFSTKDQHWEDLQNLFQVLIKYGLKISPHKCQLFRNELVYMGLQFLVKDRVAHYTAMKEKCDAIRNMQTPKSVKECRTFCGMVNFLSTFCKNLRELLIPIYDLTKKRARFQWTDTHQKAFEEIKKLLVKPPVLRMVSSDGIFRLESDTSRTAAGGTLYQWQENQWVLVGYHSKKLPAPIQNYGELN